MDLSIPTAIQFKMHESQGSGFESFNWQIIVFSFVPYSYVKKNFQWLISDIICCNASKKIYYLRIYSEQKYGRYFVTVEVEVGTESVRKKTRVGSEFGGQCDVVPFNVSPCLHFLSSDLTIFTSALRPTSNAATLSHTGRTNEACLNVWTLSEGYVIINSRMYEFVVHRGVLSERVFFFVNDRVQKS